MTLMDKIMEFEVKRYLKRVKSSLPCSFTAKRAFIAMFKEQISEFLENFPDADINDIINQFGTPEAIASEFDLKDYTAEIKKQKLKTVFFVILSVLLLIGCVLLAILLKESLEDGYFVLTDNFNKQSQN